MPLHLILIRHLSCMFPQAYDHQSSYPTSQWEGKVIPGPRIHNPSICRAFSVNARGASSRRLRVFLKLSWMKCEILSTKMHLRVCLVSYTKQTQLGHVQLHSIRGRCHKDSVSKNLFLDRGQFITTSFRTVASKSHFPTMRNN